LIYVFDVESQSEKDMHYFGLCIDALKANSESPRVFCLVSLVAARLVEVEGVQQTHRNLCFRVKKDA